MIKAIDIDNLFDKYIEGYVYENIGKIKPEEIENKIPILYKDFGKEKNPLLNGKSPEEYYNRESTSALLKCLREHIEKRIPVSDFLCEAIISRPQDSAVIVTALDKEENEEYICYLMNLLADTGAKIPVAKYLEFVLSDYSENVAELATEQLKSNAEEVKEEVLEVFYDSSENKKVRLAEILSAAKRDDRITDLLIAEFTRHPKEIPLYASFIAKYGDERALPVLTEAIERKDLPYSDFEELRFTIEALGGEYDKERDFSNDKSYKKIKNAKNQKIVVNDSDEH